MENMKEKFLVTARKWRPQRFDDLIGQEALAQALKHALQTGKIAHAYLFSGIRGVGKTSTARLLAKALNCLQLQNGEPCNECVNCSSINDGSAIDVLEIDGASHRGIDAIRDLRDTVSYMPARLRYKVYIIDEVHMLTTEASNALLKTLEEPPPHVVFILATTEAHKLLPTIRSRCQHYVFKKIPVTKIVGQLSHICDVEGYTYDKEALYVIAEAGDGSLRDAESIFDQVVIYTEGVLSLVAVREVLGISPQTFYEALWKGIVAGDVIAILRAIDEYLQHFGDVRGFVWGMVEFVRVGLLVQKLSSEDPLLDMSKERYQWFTNLFESVGPSDLVKMMQIMAEFLKGLRSDQYDRLACELLFVYLSDFRNMIPLAEIRDELLKYITGGVPGAGGMKVAGTKTGSALRVPQNKGLVVGSPHEKKPEQIAVQPILAEESPVLPSISTEEVSKTTTELSVSSPQSLSRVEGGTPLESSGVNRDVKRAFQNFLENSNITKKMIPDIESMEWDGQTLFLRVKSRYAFDYFKNTASKIAFRISEQVGIPLKIVAYGPEDRFSGTKLGSVVIPSSSLTATAERKQQGEVKSSSSSDQREGVSSDKDVISYAQELFRARRLEDGRR